MPKPRWNNAVPTPDTERQLKRQAVIVTGARMFIEKGYEKTSLEDIATALNVTRRTLYYYFDSKEEILFEALQYGLSFAEDITGRSLDASVPVLDRMTALITEYIDWVTTDFGACLVSINDGLLSPERRDLVRRAKGRMDHCVRDLIAEGITQGIFRQCDPRLAAAALYGAMNWIPFWQHNSKPAMLAPTKAEFTEFIMNGLKKDCAMA